MIAGTSAPHILLVDETSEIQAILSEALRRAGYRVTTSSFVQDLETVQGLAPDLIVHEFLFGRDGAGTLAFLQALRQDALLADVPVLLCTVAHETVVNRTLAKELRELEVSVLLKPFHLEALVSAATSACAPAQQLAG